jgi:SRSO17 transposase
MIPENRVDNGSFPIPKLLIDKEDIDRFMEEFKGFHAQFADCFSREEPRENFYQYMAGQMSQLERKSIEPIALNVESAKVRAMQHFLSDIVWEEERILSRYHGMVSEDLGDTDGVLIFDESGFVKKGNDSVGVSRQYCGNVGKVENCQVGVYAAYASRHGYGFLDNRLFIPEKWFGLDYTERREKCRLPAESSFKTKPQLAVEMLEKIVGEGVIPFRYVAADSIYGNSPEFLEAVERVPGVTSSAGCRTRPLRIRPTGMAGRRGRNASLRKPKRNRSPSRRLPGERTTTSGIAGRSPRGRKGR